MLDEVLGSWRLKVVENIGRKSPDKHEFGDTVRMLQAHPDCETGPHGTADQCGFLNVEVIHERAESIEEKGWRIHAFRFLGQSRAQQIRCNDPTRPGERDLLVFPMPHGAA